MFAVMRRVFGPVAVSVIIGAIALVFVFFGVFNPRTGGVGGSGPVASVNGEPISQREFQQEYQQRMDFYQNMFKGKADMNMLRQLGLERQIIDELVTKKLMLQEANRLGLRASDEEVRDKIRELLYFLDKKSGAFDPTLYKRLLEANRRSPAEFEEDVREDLSRGRLTQLMRGAIRATNAELEDEFLVTENRRQVQYIAVSPAALKKKGDKDNFEELRKKARGLAEQALAKAQKGSLAELKAWAKSNGLEVKSSDKFHRQQDYVPGLGDSSELMNDAFAEPSPLAKGPKLYDSRGDALVVLSVQSFKPDMKDFAKNKEKLKQGIVAKHEQELTGQWLGALKAQSKIVVEDLSANAK
jgi:hypothetical protein